MDDHGKHPSIAGQFGELRVWSLIWMVILAIPLGAGSAICLLGEWGGDDAVPAAYVACKWIAGPLYGLIGIRLLVLWINRRFDSRHQQ